MTTLLSLVAQHHHLGVLNYVIDCLKPMHIRHFCHDITAMTGTVTCHDITAMTGSSDLKKEEEFYMLPGSF